MIHRTPFVQFIPPRVDEARRRLAGSIWADVSASIRVEQSAPTARATPLSEASFAPVETFPHHWGRIFEHCWWRLTIPASATPGQIRYLHWRDQGEATLYVEGVPYAGIDPGHQRLRLPQDLADRGGIVHIASICCRTGVWVNNEPQGITERGSRHDGVALCTRDDDKWHAMVDLDVLLDLAVLEHKKAYPLNSDWPNGYGYRRPTELFSHLGRRIIDGLDRAVDVLDRDGPTAMRRATSAVFDSLPADASAMAATLVGHAHIDLVWLWPEHIGEFKAVHSFANVLDLLQRYPEHVFTYSQPASYHAVARQAPALMEKVRQAVRAGRWEPTGAMYVESDTQIACGEALVRSIELGQRDFSKLRADGSPSRMIWLPDCFGFSGILPTLMAGFGIPYFFTTKQHWSGATTFPHSSFKWVGNDGSGVLAHVAWEHYNLTASPAEIQRAELNHRQSAVHPDALVCTGYGDGGGGPNDLMCERARRLANLAGMPRVRWGLPEAFFDRMAPRADQLPTWHGEIYLEVHRGVQTTHGALKHAFRSAERGLQTLEAVHAVKSLGPVDSKPWERLVFAQFHDYITGTSVPQVYEEAIPELTGIAQDATNSAARLLASSAGQPALFNPLPVPRVWTHEGVTVRLPALAGVSVNAARIDAAPATASNGVLDNGLVRARIDQEGLLAELAVDGHRLALRRPTGRVYVLPDHPAVFEAWEIERQTLAGGAELASPIAERVESIEQGVATIRLKRSLPDGRPIVCIYRLRPSSPVLEIEYQIDWQLKQTLLKVAFDTEYLGRLARFGAPYGSAPRPQLSSTLANDAMFEVPGSRWAAVSDDGEAEGLMLVTESKYGFGASDGTLHLSLLRNASHTNHDHGPQRWTDPGQHTIRLAVGRFSADSQRDRQPALLADTLFAAPIAYSGEAVAGPIDDVLDAPSLVPAWIKPESDGSAVLRLHETLGRRGVARLALRSGVRAERIDLRGLPVRADSLAGDRLTFGPYELISLRLRR